MSLTTGYWERSIMVIPLPPTRSANPTTTSTSRTPPTSSMVWDPQPIDVPEVPTDPVDDDGSTHPESEEPA